MWIWLLDTKCKWHILNPPMADALNAGIRRGWKSEYAGQEERVSVRRSDRRGLHRLSDRLASLQVSLLRSAGPPGPAVTRLKHLWPSRQSTLTLSAALRWRRCGRSWCLWLKRNYDITMVGPDRNKDSWCLGRAELAGLALQGVGVVAGGRGPVEVHVGPAAVPPLPDPRLLRLHSARQALLVEGLGDFDVADGCGVVSQ